MSIASSRVMCKRCASISMIRAYFMSKIIRFASMPVVIRVVEKLRNRCCGLSLFGL